MKQILFQKEEDLPFQRQPFYQGNYNKRDCYTGSAIRNTENTVITYLPSQRKVNLIGIYTFWPPKNGPSQGESGMIYYFSKAKFNILAR